MMAQALSATGLQTLQSSTQRGHCLLSASVKPTVGTDGASPGRSSHSYHSKCGDPVGGHCFLSASGKPTVGTDGASPGRSSHSYHSKCGDPVGSCLTITMCRSPT